MTTYILCFQMGMVVLILLQIHYFDRVVRAAYLRRREFWEATGRPRGFFWAAPGTAKWAHATWVATTRLWWSILLRTQVWMQSDDHLKRQVFGFRVFCFAMWIFFFTWLGIGIWTGKLP